MSGTGQKGVRRAIWLRPALYRWRLRVILAGFLVAAIATVWVTNRLLTERFTAAPRVDAALRLALYSGNLLSELRAHASLPQVLALDQALIMALESGDYSQTSQRLISFVEELGSAGLMLIDNTGRTVAATNRSALGEIYRNDAFFVDAARGQGTIFTLLEPFRRADPFYHRSDRCNAS